MTPFNALNLEHVDPEVKSYIYQTILEFEPYCTPNTQVAVVAKDPLKLIPRYEAEGFEYDRKVLKNLYRISITLHEDGTKLEEEGLHESIFEAMRIAKEKLIKVLSEIQDSVISTQERAVQINTARENTGIH